MAKSEPLVALLACCGFVLLTGCSEAGPGADANAVTELRSQLLGEFPEDVPVYPGITGPDVTELGDGFEVSGATYDGLEQVHAYYTDALEDHGWTLDERLSDIDSPRSRVYQYTKGDRGVLVITSVEGDQTVIETAYKSTPMY